MCACALLCVLVCACVSVCKYLGRGGSCVCDPQACAYLACPALGGSTGIASRLLSLSCAEAALAAATFNATTSVDVMLCACELLYVLGLQWRKEWRKEVAMEESAGDSHCIPCIRRHGVTVLCHLLLSFLWSRCCANHRPEVYVRGPVAHVQL